MHRQTASTKATSSQGALTVGSGNRLWTTVRPTSRPLARSRLAPYRPARPASGSSSAASSRASHAGSTISVSLWSRQMNSVSVRRQARLRAAITLPLVSPRVEVSGYGYGKRSRNSPVPSLEPVSVTTRRKGSVVVLRLSRQARVCASPLKTAITRLTRGAARTASLALVDRDVRDVRRAGVLGARPDQPVVGVLLHHVGRPTDDTAHREDRRELVGRDPHRRVRGSGVEVDVREDLLLLAHDADDRVQDLDGTGVAGLLAELLGQPMQVLGPRVFHAVDPLAEAHDTPVLGH